ncbi:MAG: diacylglycerol kinase family protein [Chitinophagales bacterium]
MKRIAFIIHGKAKGASALAEKAKLLFAEHDVLVEETKHIAHATEIACDAVKAGYRYIVCAGGDGSLNETANGVMKGVKVLPEHEQHLVRLAVLPLGTGNDFIKTIQSPSTIETLYQSIQNDTCTLIDLGHATYFTVGGEKVQRWFVNITDVGMGGVVAERLSRYSKWMGAALTYQRAIVGTLLTYKNQAIEVKSNSFSYTGSVMNFVVANGKYFGSGLGIAPDANVADGKFSIVILGEISMLDYIKNLGNVKKCKRILHPQMKYMEAEYISIHAPQGKLPIDMDGEFVGYSPIELQLVKQAIHFVV